MIIWNILLWNPHVCPTRTWNTLQEVIQGDDDSSSEKVTHSQAVFCMWVMHHIGYMPVVLIILSYCLRREEWTRKAITGQCQFVWLWWANYCNQFRGAVRKAQINQGLSAWIYKLNLCLTSLAEFFEEVTKRIDSFDALNGFQQDLWRDFVWWVDQRGKSPWDPSRVAN